PFGAARILPCRPRKALSPSFGLSISWSGKRNLAGRDWRAISGAECGRTAGIRFADRDTPRYRTEIARVFVYPETASVCRDSMVGDAGIELMATAPWHPFKTRRRVARFSARNDLTQRMSKPLAGKL